MNPGARFDTLCIHAGQAPDPTNGAIMTPVYFTSTYVQEGLGINKGFDYARVRNPTRDAVEANLAALEGLRGMDVFVVLDACASRREESEVIAWQRLRQAGVALVSVEMVLHEWLRESGTDAFTDLTPFL